MLSWVQTVWFRNILILWMQKVSTGLREVRVKAGVTLNSVCQGRSISVCPKDANNWQTKTALFTTSQRP